MIEIKIKKLHPNARIPERANDFAGGWDVVATEVIKISENEYMCKLGFAVEIPIGYKLTLVPRSSITKTHLIQQNSPGLGDCDYRGEYAYKFKLLAVEVDRYTGEFGYTSFPYMAGDRIGQVYLEEVIPIRFLEVESLSETQRGDGGFGSTGK